MITRRDFLKGAGLGAAALMAPGVLAEAPGDRRKLNVLFVMSDQHSARALGCYGNREVATPNLDRLAREGVRFERAFCQSPQCCPSRYTIWTGRHARTHGLYWNGMMENPAEVTVAELFKQAGYVTGTIGKNHMHMSPVNGNHGFDVVIDHKGGEFARKGTFLPFDKVHPGGARVGESDADNDHHPAGIHAAAAMKFLAQNRRKPFCLWLSFYGPHTPICASRPWARKYDPERLTLPPNNQYDFDLRQPGLKALQEKWAAGFTPDLHRKTLAYYYALVSQIDHNIGRVLDELDRLGLAKDTLVVYTADHGEMMSEHGAWTKGRTGYDATVRVPMILRWPDVLPAAKRNTELVGLIDLLPTLLEAACVRAPKNLQGRSLLPLARGAGGEWREFVFSELGTSTQDTCLVARSRTHKHVLYRKGGKTQYEQLFDLQADPWEMHNQIDNPQCAEPLAGLKKALAQWEATTPAATPGERRRPARAARQNA